MPSSRSKALSALRRALQTGNVQNWTFRQLYHFVSDEAATSNSDRAAALIVGTILEEVLEIAISTHFVGWTGLAESEIDKQRNLLFGYSSYELSPLSSFAARI